MEQLITAIANNGIGIVCVAYLIYFQNSTMKRMIDTLGTISKRLEVVEGDIKELKNK